MSLLTRLTSTVRSLSRDPSVRRGVRDLGRAAVRAATDGRGGSRGGSRGTATRGRQVEGAAGGEDDVLADRRPGVPLHPSYDPHEDDRPDPGEIVWAWVHYEEDIAQGKDRPVLVIAEEDASIGGADGSGTVLVALMLTSRDRTEAGATRTDEHGATWVDIGAGDWDRQGRPSEVRADRLLRLVPDAVRREGARLDRERFDRVVTAVRSVAS
jgi:hypothetical protein